MAIVFSATPFKVLAWLLRRFFVEPGGEESPNKRNKVGENRQIGAPRR
jgi:hypothetical protein